MSPVASVPVWAADGQAHEWRCMSNFQLADSFYVGVLDPDAASAWYVEKLDLQQVISMEDEEGCVSLAFSKKDTTAIVLGPRGRATDPTTPMLYASKIQKARESLISRGVTVGPLEKDRQGTHYFVFSDLDGNQIEVSEEP